MSLRAREITAEFSASPEDDILKFAELLKLHKPTWTDPIKNDPLTTSQTLLKSKNYRMFAVENDQGAFIMAMGARRWDWFPFYTLSHFRTIEFLNIREFKSAFSPLMQTLVGALEAEGRLEFWYLIEDKPIYSSREERHGRNILQYLVACLDDYIIFDEIRVPAGTKPTWPIHLSLLSDRPARVTTLIRRAIHKRKLGLPIEPSIRRR